MEKIEKIEKTKKNKKKQKNPQKALIIILSILVGLGLLIFAGYMLLMDDNSILNNWIQQNNKVVTAVRPEAEGVSLVELKTVDPFSVATPSPEPTEEPLWAVDQKDPNVINILVYGIDTRDKEATGEEEGNSDSMMLISANTETKRVCVFSLLRDGACYPWNKAKKDKINKAYANGGITNLLNNVINGSRNFDLDVQYYIGVNFNMFVEIVDQFGGIPVDMTKEEADFINNKIAGERERTDGNDYMAAETSYVSSRKGVHYLNGEQALWYCRDRYSAGTDEDGNEANSDYGRTARQRKFLSSLYEVAMKEITPSKLVKIANIVADNAITNISATRILQLLSMAAGGDFTIQSTTIPFPGTEYSSTNEEGNYLLEYDMVKARKKLHGIIYDNDPMPGHEDGDEEVEETPVPEPTEDPSVTAAPSLEDLDDTEGDTYDGETA